MLEEGLEPTLLAEPDPKSGASANFATRAEDFRSQPQLNIRRRRLNRGDVMSTGKGRRFAVDSPRVGGLDSWRCIFQVP